MSAVRARHRPTSQPSQFLRAPCHGGSFRFVGKPGRRRKGSLPSRARREGFMNMIESLEQVTVERDGAVAVISLNRPQKRNALSLSMMRDLDAALAAAGADAGVHAVILRGNGPGVFRRSRFKRTRRSRRGRVSHDLRRLRRFDGASRCDSAAGDCRGRSRRNGGGLPARSGLRPRRGLGERDVCDARRSHRFVLQHADGGTEPRDREQARDGNAADRRADLRGDGARVGFGKSSRPKRAFT